MKKFRVTAIVSAVGIALHGLSASSLLAASPRAQRVPTSTVAESPTGRYFVTFVEAGLAQYRGDVPGYARTAPAYDRVTLQASGKYDESSSAALTYRTYLASRRDLHVRQIEQALGRSLSIHYVYDVARSAVSVDLTADEARIAERIAGVASVSPVTVWQPETFRGPSFIGANTIWDGSGVPDYAAATRGQGVKAGILDTGSYAAHPSFANDPVCGFDGAHPKLIAKDCINSSQCTGASPEADPNDGHGVHTASTMAGNTIDNTAVPAPLLLPDGVTMSGVAPCAELHTYKVCNTQDCFADAIAAGIQNAIADQVDVINLSLGPCSGGGDPWQDDTLLDLLTAEGANVFVAAAAGNLSLCVDDPVGKVANNAPWITTVAASSQDEALAPALSITGPGTPPDSTQNILLTPSTSTLPPLATVDANGVPPRVYEANLLGCSDSGGFPASYFDGSIAVIQRGTCTFTEKITNAYGAGARTVVVTNNASGPLTMNTTTLDPAVAADVAAFSTDQTPGDALIAFVEANPAAVGRYDRSRVHSIQGDVLASFSLRGPMPYPYQDLTKPDITGPGVNIYAALDAASGNYGLLSGTSMSSPHLAGAGALVRAVQPDWTPMEIKSALQTTATLDGFQEDGTTPWTPDEIGSGRVDLAKATRAGLTLDETEADFRAASPYANRLARAMDGDAIFSDGFDPPPSSSPISELNLASLRNAHCDTQCGWTRTFRNRLHESGTWTVSSLAPDHYGLSAEPSTFTLAPGDTQTVRFTATRTGVPPRGVMQFGRVDLIENGGRSPDQHLTVAVSTETSTVSCTNGSCVFQLDVNNLSGGLGCITGWAANCQELWLNRFTPDPASYPITLTSVSTVFANYTGWNDPGDQVSVYVYQDDDANPSNGATPKGAQNYTMPFVATQFVQIPLDPPVVLDGPGDVLIGLANPYPTNGGGVPASADAGPFRGRSWVGQAVNDANGTVAPDLASPDVALLRNDNPSVAFPYNWLIRAQGTDAAGRSITLEPADR